MLVQSSNHNKSQELTYSSDYWQEQLYSLFFFKVLTNEVSFLILHDRKRQTVYKHTFHCIHGSQIKGEYIFKI